MCGKGEERLPKEWAEAVVAMSKECVAGGLEREKDHEMQLLSEGGCSNSGGRRKPGRRDGSSRGGK